MSKFKIILLLILPFSMAGQVVNGTLYDSKSTAKNVKITNTSTKLITYSDANGNFKIKADIGDSLVFSSVFYNEKTVALNENHFNQTIVIQLKKTVNQLGEVLIQEEPKFKEFSAEEHNATVQLQIQEDRKNQYYLYNPAPNPNMDFITIKNLIGKLFKKNRPEPIEYADYKDLDNFFNSNDFFNNDLLKDELMITKDYRFLFFEYCAARNIDKKKLSDDHQLELLDTFINYSVDFLKILNENKKE